MSVRNLVLDGANPESEDFYMNGRRITQMWLNGVCVWDICENTTVFRGWISEGNSISMLGLTCYIETMIFPSVSSDGVWSYPSETMSSHYNQEDVVGTIDWGDGNTETYHSGRDSNGNYQRAEHTYSDTYIAEHTEENGIWVEIKVDCDIKYISVTSFLESTFKLHSIELADSIENTYSSLFVNHTNADTQSLKLSSSTVFLNNMAKKSNITDLTIPESVKYLGLQGCYCQIPTTTILNNSVFSMYTWIFESCEKLESVSIEGNVKLIGYGAFAYNYKLKSIHLPNSLECIGNYAFYYCYNLENIVVSSNLKYIHARAFFRVNDVSSGKTDYYQTYIDNPIDIYKTLDLDTKIDIFEIPESVEYIGTESFWWAYSKTILLPSTLKCIGTKFFVQSRSNCSDIFYRGTTESWFENVITAGEENTSVPSYEYLYLASRITQKQWYKDNSSNVGRIVCTDGVIINPYWTIGHFKDGSTLAEKGYYTGDDCFNGSDGQAIKEKFTILNL